MIVGILIAFGFIGLGLLCCFGTVFSFTIGLVLLIEHLWRGLGLVVSSGGFLLAAIYTLSYGINILM